MLNNIYQISLYTNVQNSVFNSRCLDTSGGYLFHDPIRAARIVESCVALNNCAKIAGLPIKKDFYAKDSFVGYKDPVEQPTNAAQGERIPFGNLRKEYIARYFNPEAVRLDKLAEKQSKKSKK